MWNEIWMLNSCRGNGQIVFRVLPSATWGSTKTRRRAAVLLAVWECGRHGSQWQTGHLTLFRGKTNKFTNTCTDWHITVHTNIPYTLGQRLKSHTKQWVVITGAEDSFAALLWLQDFICHDQGFWSVFEDQQCTLATLKHTLIIQHVSRYSNMLFT